MNIVAYSVMLNDESFTNAKGLKVLNISHADPADIVFTLPEEEGKRFLTLYDPSKKENNPRIRLTMASAPADLTQDPPPTAKIKGYELKVCNIDIDDEEGIYVFTCAGKLKR